MLIQWQVLTKPSVMEVTKEPCRPLPSSASSTSSRTSVDEGGSEGGGPVSLSTKQLVYIAADIQKLQEKVFKFSTCIHILWSPPYLLLHVFGRCQICQRWSDGGWKPSHSKTLLLWMVGDWTSNKFMIIPILKWRCTQAFWTGIWLFNSLFSSLLAALFDSRARLSSSVPSLNSRMSQHLTERCCRFLKSAAEVPRLYRRTNKVRCAAAVRLRSPLPHHGWLRSILRLSSCHSLNSSICCDVNDAVVLMSEF